MQVEFFPITQRNHKMHSNGTANRMAESDRRFHDWYRFVLSFPPHLVRYYLNRFGLESGQILLDPFCGTGTTLVVAKALGIVSIGIEANPMAHFASEVKVDWEIDPSEMKSVATQVAETSERDLMGWQGKSLLGLPPESQEILLSGSISPIPLHKSLVLLKNIRAFVTHNSYRHLLLAFAKSTVAHASNLHFGPEVGVRTSKREDAPVVMNWLTEVLRMTEDITLGSGAGASSKVILGDSRFIDDQIQPKTVDAVFTSPPYPNEKDYTRSTRLESVLLGHIRTKQDLRELKKGLLRSNTRTAFRTDNDDEWISGNLRVEEVADQIESRRIALEKTSGFERQYARVTKLYFGGMFRHLFALREVLKPGARLGYVVGDQASYLQVMINTGEILAEIAESLGYEVLGLDLFRTRFATATKQQLREEVLLLRWPECHIHKKVGDRSA
ncbi:MAG: site-specific DNA-methyltransferase [Calditrichaeota bacterium]|nr:site-specific DNA-methyltransferase [Calditrichota bacterium]